MKYYYLLIIFPLVIVLLTGFTTLQDKLKEEQQIQQQLKCSPANSINCSGWEI